MSGVRCETAKTKITILVAEMAQDIEECFRIRTEVFIVEQGVPADMERDEYDQNALHVLALAGDEYVGTARAVISDHDAFVKIGRLAVRRSNRGAGIGALLMAAIETAPALHHVRHFVLNAQAQAMSFYRNLGYEAEGDVFIEAGIPHYRMKKSLSP